MTVHLTPAEGKLLRVLQDRHRAGLPSHAAWAHRSRMVIVGPEFPEGRVGYVVARTSANAVRALRRHGLIGASEPLEPLGSYAGRRHGDQTDGEPVWLTDAGRRTCPCGAQDLSSEQVEFCSTPSARDHSYRPRGLS